MKHYDRQSEMMMCTRSDGYEKKKMGLLVMAYGTPYKEEDIERYYTHIRMEEANSRNV